MTSNSSWFCPACGQQNQPQFQFCFKCGNANPVSSIAAPQEKPESPPPLPEKKKRNWWLIGFCCLIGYVIFIGFLARTRPASPSQNSNKSNLASASPSPTTTPKLPPGELLTTSKRMIAASYTKESYNQAIKYLSEIPKDAKEHAEASRLIDKATKTYLVEELAGPPPQTSPWDRKVYCVDRYLKQVLNDYGSAEYMQWGGLERAKVKGVAYWRVRLKLRAKNGFGAKIIKVYTFMIQNDQVVSATD